MHRRLYHPFRIRESNKLPAPYFSHRAASSCDCRHKTAPAVIAGSVIGSLLASIIVLVLLFVLWRRKSRNRARNNASGDNVPGMTFIPNNPILSPILISSTHSGPIESITSDSAAVSRRLSQTSRTAYEEEIEQLRQQIRCMEEEMTLTYSGSAPPSYRSSRRSDVSDPFGPSSSPPPPLPSREIVH